MWFLIAMEVGARARAWRLVRQETIEALARKVGTSPTRLSRFERGVGTLRLGGDVNQFGRLLLALELTPIQFYGPITVPRSGIAQAA